MKPFSSLLAIVLFVFISGQIVAQNPKAKAKSDKSSMSMPYTASYSSNFQMGDPKFSAIVLNAWKSYDDNTFDQSVNDLFADTIHAYLGDGTVVVGKDSFVNAIKGYRGSFTSAKSEVVAYMAVKSVDKKDNIVFVWGSETDTKTDGTTQKFDLHEVWAFNKDGKVDFFKQFMVQSPPMTK